MVLTSCGHVTQWGQFVQCSLKTNVVVHLTSRKGSPMQTRGTDGKKAHPDSLLPRNRKECRRRPRLKTGRPLRDLYCRLVEAPQPLDNCDQRSTPQRVQPTLSHTGSRIPKRCGYSFCCTTELLICFVHVLLKHSAEQDEGKHQVIARSSKSQLINPSDHQNQTLCVTFATTY